MTALDEPQRIVAALEAAGWERFGGDGVRFVSVCRLGRVLYVPIDPTAAGYGDDVDLVVSQLAELERQGRDARKVLDALTDQGVIV